MMLSTQRLIIVCCLFFTCSLQAQDYIPNIQIQANHMAHATVHGDLESIADHTYPDIVSMVGGREHLINTIRQQFTDMKNEQMYFRKIEIGMPSEVVMAGEELHCLVPQTIVLELPEGQMTTRGYLLAISQDQGEQWYFIDTAQLTNENIETILPNYNQDLKIPIYQNPVLEKVK